jgi:hypothetical protein
MADPGVSGTPTNGEVKARVAARRNTNCSLSDAKWQAEPPAPQDYFGLFFPPSAFSSNRAPLKIAGIA